ncbi:MAG TPA: MFS transporter [Pseudomonadales bacterium]|nr:MFS transporter [Pseudomonadales bacterium]
MSDAESEAQRDAPLPARTLIAYSSLTLPMAALGLPISVYLPPFYAEEIGLSLATVGTVFTLARIWDVVTDPLMGVVVDRVQSRFGRFRQWILLAVPLLCLASWFVYFPPATGVGAGYLLGWMLVLYGGYTLLAISHQSWGAELAQSYDERARLFGWRELFIVGGMASVLALPALTEFGFDGGLDASALEFRKIGSMGLFMLVLLPITAIWIVAVVPEPPRAAVAHRLEWRASLALLTSNRVLRRLLLADLLIGLAVGISGALYIFLATYTFELRSIASLALLSYFVAGFAGMPVWMRLAYRIGKHGALAVAMVYLIVVLLALYALAAPGETLVLLAGTLLFGFGFGAGPALTRALIADASDEDELHNGRRRAGLFFALLTTTNKVGGALAVGISYFILEWGYGFVPGADNAPAAAAGILDVYIFGPCLCMAGAALLMVAYPLDRKRHDAIRLALRRREPEAGATTTE